MVSPKHIARSLRLRLKALFHSHAQLSEEQTELERLSGLPPRCTTTANLIGRSFDTNDGRAFAHMYKMAFHSQTCRFVCDSEQPTIIDCGANVGVTVLYWKHLYPHARIVALEADSVICEMLRHNCEGMSDVTVLEAAAWTENGELDFNMEGSLGGHLADLSESTDRGTNIKVRSVRLRDLLTDRIDLLKLDIEGAEIDVLADCFDQLSNVDRLFVEYHAFVDRDQRIGEFFSLLEDAGFVIHVHEELPAPQPFISRPVINGKHHRLNVFASKRQLPEAFLLQPESHSVVDAHNPTGIPNCTVTPVSKQEDTTA